MKKENTTCEWCDSENHIEFIGDESARYNYYKRYRCSCCGYEYEECYQTLHRYVCTDMICEGAVCVETGENSFTMIFPNNKALEFNFTKENK